MKPTPPPYSTLLVIALAIAKTIEVIWLYGKGWVNSWILVGLSGLRLG
jgi:hypothetical protein